MNINVYHILDHYQPLYSGYTFRTRSILTTQKKLGFTVEGFVSPLYSEGLKDEEVIDGIKFTRSKPYFKSAGKIPVIRELLSVRKFSKDILKVLKSKPKGIIHAHSPVLNALSAYKVAKELGMPFVYEVRAFWEDAAVDMGKTKEKSLRYKLTKDMETSILRKADRVITICEGLKNDMIIRGIDKEKIFVVGNGVNLDVFSPKEKDISLIQKYNLQGKTVLGFIGSFYHYEGLDLLIKAMPLILKENKDVILMLVGNGTQFEKLQNLVKEMNLKNNVIFTDKVSHEQVTKYYSVIDVLVYPRNSIRLTELVTPLKPLEAMACGKAVIGSDIGGIKEVVPTEEVGLLFKAGNVSSLAECCLALLNDQDKRTSLGEKGRQYVVETRNWLNLIKQHETIYKELLRYDQ